MKMKILTLFYVVIFYKQGKRYLQLEIVNWGFDFGVNF